MTDLEQQDNYWSLVERCLAEIHGWPVDRAAEVVLSARSVWRQRAELGYHVEPFDTAVDLANRDLPRLDRIALAKRLWEAHGDHYKALVQAAQGAQLASPPNSSRRTGSASAAAASRPRQPRPEPSR